MGSWGKSPRSLSYTALWKAPNSLCEDWQLTKEYIFNLTEFQKDLQHDDSAMVWNILLSYYLPELLLLIPKRTCERSEYLLRPKCDTVTFLNNLLKRLRAKFST